MIGTLTIRADCSPSIGTGHVMRMIALGQAWQEIGGKVQFVGHSSALDDRLRDEGFSTIALSPSLTRKEELATLTSVTALKDWIAIDGYHFDVTYQTAVRKAGRQTIVLDDIMNRDSYNCDVLLNQNLDALTYPYVINSEATPLLGPRYTLLRKEFRDALSNLKPIQSTAHNILVTLGGADPTGATSRIIDAIKEIKSDNLHLKIVVGATNLKRAEVEQKARQLQCKYDLLPSVKNMAQLMTWADLAISAAGSTCWELCFLGVPFIAIQTAMNQQGVITELTRRGVAHNLDTTGPLRDIAAQINEVISNRTLRQTMQEKGQNIVDGNGAMRVASHIYTAGIRLRPAHTKDCVRLFEWRNSPLTRANSFNSNEIQLADHKSWFEKKLKDTSCLFLVAEDRIGTPVGQIRFDLDKNEATLSLSVAPNKHNMGVGTVITQLGCITLAKKWPNAKALALVKKDNAASAAMFEKSGFQKDESPSSDHIKYTWLGNNND